MVNLWGMNAFSSTLQSHLSDEFSHTMHSLRFGTASTDIAIAMDTAIEGEFAMHGVLADEKESRMDAKVISFKLDVGVLHAATERMQHVLLTMTRNNSIH